MDRHEKAKEQQKMRDDMRRMLLKYEEAPLTERQRLEAAESAIKEAHRDLNDQEDPQSVETAKQLAKEQVERDKAVRQRHIEAWTTPDRAKDQTKSDHEYD